MHARSTFRYLSAVIAAIAILAGCSDGVAQCHRDADAWRASEKSNLTAHIQSLVAKGADKAMFSDAMGNPAYGNPIPSELPSVSYGELFDAMLESKRPAAWNDDHWRVWLDHRKKDEAVRKTWEADRDRLIQLRRELALVDTLYSQRIKSCSGSRSADR